MRSLGARVIKGRATTAAIALLMAATVAGTAGCAAARSELGTSSSVCFRAIPVGRAAVTAKPSTFVGVRSASEKDIDKFGSTHDSIVAALIQRNGGKLKGLCLIAFHGSFEPTSVHELLGPVPPVGQRAYAVVVVSEPSNKLLATVIRSKEPISFTHYAVGG